MAGYVAKKVLQHIIQHSGNIRESNVLVMGATFKENVSDIRNSKVADVVKELRSFSLNVDVVDPYASSDELQHEYGFGLKSEIGKGYDAVIVTVPHDPYRNLDDSFFSSITKTHAMIADLKGIYRGKINQRLYWSL
jgi:UDP-N-acetyl-D-galactosamine dehydrogenase